MAGDDWDDEFIKELFKVEEQALKEKEEREGAVHTLSLANGRHDRPRDWFYPSSDDHEIGSTAATASDVLQQGTGPSTQVSTADECVTRNGEHDRQGADDRSNHLNAGGLVLDAYDDSDDDRLSEAECLDDDDYPPAEVSSAAGTIADTAAGAMGPAASSSRASHQVDIRQFFGGLPPTPLPPPKRVVDTDIRSFFSSPRGAPGPTVAPKADPARRDAKRQRRGGASSPFAGGAAHTNGQLRSCPFYKKISGTPFAVDAFAYGPVPGIRAYILSHFHSDHYMGLGPGWDAGPIYCTVVTARLVLKRLRVNVSFIRPIPLDTPTSVEGFQITFHDANHCPGAAVIAIRPTGRPRPLIVHTGDFRAGAQFIGRPEIRALARCDTLYLDTTYCDERYAFLPQEEALEVGVSAALAALKAAPRTLIVVGAYSIGKERVYLSIAKALGRKIFVDGPRKALIDCMEWPELQERLTQKREDTNIHVLPIGQLNAKGLSEYLAKCRSMYDRVVGFRPTGWTHGTQKPLQGPGRGGVAVYPLPYSEHSSVSELQGFVQMMRPGRILATVNVGSPAKRALMTDLFKKWMQQPERATGSSNDLWR